MDSNDFEAARQHQEHDTEVAQGRGEVHNGGNTKKGGTASGTDPAGAKVSGGTASGLHQPTGQGSPRQ